MRFYVSPEYIYPEKNIIEVRDRQEAHHIRDVMRLPEDTEVSVFDGRGTQYEGRIKNISRASIIIEIVSTIRPVKSLTCEITLYQAVPKKGKMDFIIEKAAELGVSKIIPMITRRASPGVKRKAGVKIERWNRIAKAASKQCGRVTLPFISEPRDYSDCLAESKGSGLVVFAALDEGTRPIREILRNSRPASVSVFVGPEGDFSDEEIMAAKGLGYAVCSLGPLVLRVETAAIYILSCLNYEYS